MADQNAAPSTPKPGFFRGLMALACRQWRILVALGGGVFIGLAIFGTWQTVIEHTNHTEFCITCHIMKDSVYEEYKQSVHFKNKHGVQVGCPDCHVPIYSWIDEAMAKVNTIGELYAFFIEGKTTAAALEKDRPALAKHVWARFAATNARECRHCHQYSGMVLDEQKPSARVAHTDAGKKDQNCVECHRGITHKLPPSDTPAKDSDSFDVE